MGNDIETIIIYLFVGFMCLLTIFVMVILPIILTKQYYKEQKKNLKKYIRFDTPFCSFLWEDQAEPGYEGEIEWEYNPEPDKSCGLFFETDTIVSPPEEGYLGLAMARSDFDEDTDLEIEKLIQVMPELNEIRPGKCYRKLESILSDKERIDTEIRQVIADYFWFKPELISENSTREELMEGISVSFITVYRNGVTEYGIFNVKDIYVDDLRVIINEDGTRDIQYKEYV